MRMTFVTAALAIVALGGTAWLVARQWMALGVDVSTLGWAAYAAGGLLSFAVSGGLFYLLFYSARNGHDDLDDSAP